MDRMAKTAENKAKKEELKRRLAPRLLWPSTQEGPAIRVDTVNGPEYTHKPIVKKKSNARKLTEAEDNAIGRAHRRRQNKSLRGWLPHAKR